MQKGKLDLHLNYDDTRKWTKLDLKRLDLMWFVLLLLYSFFNIRRKRHRESWATRSMSGSAPCCCQSLCLRSPWDHCWFPWVSFVSYSLLNGQQSLIWETKHVHLKSGADFPTRIPTKCVCYASNKHIHTDYVSLQDIFCGKQSHEFIT